ncbi:DUF3237 domain-containing protein [Novosphingobium piscinae]|uniref:UPF0311 protein H7F53_14270 n=1 Tax=Novosphingobium piscinae TaxID=1507448 RepID=A0A7X1KR16_9SPHN|nr:DUF3237 domain-containing protein [Novosphingobium piscinae]MBC2670316.1 DUF3237 domain-containing protein [Novosphingobium piscinae]
MTPHPLLDQPAPAEDPFALRWTHAFDIRLAFAERMTIGPVVAGGPSQAYTPVGQGSTVSGPLLNGRVIDFSGADWPSVRSDGVVELAAHYLLEADDGTPIYIRNLGYVHGPQADQGVPAYFRCTPYFRAPAGAHDWLNRKVLVGIGQRRPKLTADDPPDHSLFRYYVIL